MSVTLLPAAARAPVPWRNGRGITREIAVSPPGAALEFDWRISMAELNGAAPFSRFAGTDRILTMLAGALELRFANGDTRRLTPDSEPLAFAGEEQCEGEALGEAALDLNVMVRRGAYAASVTRLAAGAAVDVSGLGVLLALAQSRATLGGAGWDLRPYDALLVRENAGALRIESAALFVEVFTVATHQG